MTDRTLQIPSEEELQEIEERVNEYLRTMEVSSLEKHSVLTSDKFAGPIAETIVD